MLVESFVGMVAKQIAEILAEIIAPPQGGQGFFAILRKEPSVTVSWSDAVSPKEISLRPLQYKTLGEGNQTFQVPDGQVVKVYREPAQISLTVRLQFPQGSDAENLAALDRLQSYFFDARSIAPVLPPIVKGTALGQSISGMSAELLLCGIELQPLSATLEYRGPYHSGTALREDKRVTHRDLRVSVSTERSPS